MRSETEKKVADRYQKEVEVWSEHRDVNVEEAPKAQHVGQYKYGPTTLSFKLESLIDSQEHLTVTFGGVEETKLKL